MRPMPTADMARLMRGHARDSSPALLDSWLTHATLCRYRDWVPPPSTRDALLVDIGCYQPSIGYYDALGWTRVVGIAKEEGEGSRAAAYRTPAGLDARIVIADVETAPLPIPDQAADVVLMMEVLEHFGLDPMYAIAEANRILKPSGLLVISTPNAASLANLRRIAAGLGPFTAIEFSGFSTNRHNRLYDVAEVQMVLRAGGFDVEVCESRTYREHEPAASVSDLAWRVRDWWTSRRTGRRVERGDYLFARGLKRSAVTDRYPRSLYFDAEQWPEWYGANRRRA